VSPNFEISPVKLVYGGDALGFHAGRTILAPRVLPAERAEVQEVRRQKGVVHARPLRILNPSPERIEPACGYFGRCGGCHYQHMSHQAQLAAKTEILRETLRRLGKVNWEGPIPTHSGSPWNYRNQAQFKVKITPEGAPALGFYEAESNHLIPIDACPILSPRLNAMLATLRTSPWIDSFTNCREVELMADDRDEKVMVTLAGNWDAEEGESLARRFLKELEGIHTVALLNDSRLEVFGEPHVTYRVGDFAYRVSPTSFFQSARFLLDEMVTAVAGGESGSVAIDLFAGVGLFTMPLAEHFDRVMAVESHSQAASDLGVNAATASRKNIQAISATAFDFLRRCAQMEPDLVVMDPPRGGVDVATLKQLLNLRPRRLHYLSCSPPTLARDLGFLLKHGYQVECLDLFDCFPQTYHIESLACLSRGE
jgi:23S rRNA (uracil1939-C5)-methyltransferase